MIPLTSSPPTTPAVCPHSLQMMTTKHVNARSAFHTHLRKDATLPMVREIVRAGALLILS